MRFTYDAYRKLLKNLKNSGYEFIDYKDCQKKEWCVIIRHDIDYDMEKAVKLAEIEKDSGGVSATYFVLLSSDFYNAFSKKTYDGLRKIIGYGHNIGLHFDETRYSEFFATQKLSHQSSGSDVGKTSVCAPKLELLKEKITEEAELLSKIIGNRVDVVSMHRPSKSLLEADLKIPGMINSYSQIFFKEFKYLSDSRRRWREPIDEIIQNKQFKRLHILTHAFWYNNAEMDIKDSVRQYIKSGNMERYIRFESNITDLASIMSREEV